MSMMSKLKTLKTPTPEEVENILRQTNQFAKAIIDKDLSMLEPLLHVEFIYFDTKTKWETLKYFNEQLQEDIPHEMFSRKVNHLVWSVCQPGNPALFFHGGYFPILEKERNRLKAIALTFKDGKISDLTLCYGFCNTNKLQELAEQN